MSQTSPKSAKLQRRQKRSKHKRGTSEVGRFFQSLLKNEDESSRTTKTKRKHSHKKFRSLRLTSPSRELDAEALTAEERLSRLLHTPKPKIKLPESGILYDHFVVVGTPDHLERDPKILFKYPPTTALEIPGLADFCFPAGVKSKSLPQSICKSEMIALLHNQQYLKQPENSFVFLFTDQESQVFYGICVHKEEILEEPPGYMRGILVPPEIQTTTTRCYCLITRFPFFRFHFEFLFSLFAVEHLTRLESEAPSILEEKEEIEVFLSPSTPQREKKQPPRFLSRSDSGNFLLDPRSPRLERHETNVQKDDDVSDVLDDIPPEEELPELVVSDAPKNEKKKVAIMITQSSQTELPKPEAILPSENHQDATNQNESDKVQEQEQEQGSFQVRPLLKPSQHSSPSILKRTGIRRHASEGNEQSMIKRIDISADSIRTDIELHPCIQAMKRYRELKIPQKGQKVSFVSSEYLNEISFSRPFFDEEEELFAEWGLPLTLAKLSFSTLCEFISAILLEKKILVYAKTLRVLSALVLAFPPLIRPFTYQSVIIPMLPDKMESFLEAPVPFVVGTIKNPENMDIPADVVILDATKDIITHNETIALLPRQDELNRKCSSFVGELKTSFANELPFRTTMVQRQLVDSICTVFETHFDSLFANFHNYTICNMSDPQTPISVFMKDSFLDDIEEEELPFIEPFIATQAFFEYSDLRLRKRDNGE